MSAAVQPRRRARVSPGHALKDTVVIVRRNLLRVVRLPQLLLLATVQPVMFLILFNYVFGGAVGRAIPAAAGGQYLNWLLPGLLLQVAAFGSTQTSMGLIEDLNKGVIDRFRSLPMARSAVLAGRTLADLIRNALVIGLMIALGYTLGFRPQTSFVPLVGALLVALAFAYTALSIEAHGQAIKTSENAWVTDLTPTSANIVQLVRAARARWKIENEGFNTLKHQIFHAGAQFRPRRPAPVRGVRHPQPDRVLHAPDPRTAWMACTSGCAPSAGYPHARSGTRCAPPSGCFCLPPRTECWCA